MYGHATEAPSIEGHRSRGSCLASPRARHRRPLQCQSAVVKNVRIEM